MKKIIVIVIALTLTVTALLLIKHNETKKQYFALEWHEIMPQTRLVMLTMFEQLQAVWVEANVPVQKPMFYAYDPRAANILAEKKQFVDQKINAGIIEGLRAGFNGKINKLYADLQNQLVSEAYVVIAKDIQRKIIGFALMVKTPLKNHIDSQLMSIVDGSRDAIDTSKPGNDEMFVQFLAVASKTQKKGVGKALLFSVFDHCPHIEKIYLKTSASDLNKNAQAFYEHIGFTRVLKGIFTLDKGEPVWGQESIVYMYQKP